MSFRTKDPALADHLAWLGYVQPEGLVVSAPALVDAQAIIDRAQLGDLQRRFAEHVSDLSLTESDTGETQPGIADLARFFTEFLGWPYELLLGVDPSRPLPDSLYISLPEFQETLRPTFAILRKDRATLRPGDSGTPESHSPKVSQSQSPFLLLIQQHPATVDLDKPAANSERGWHASASRKFERLLRETGVPIGLLTNGTQFRLIYAPPKENSGTLTFPVGAMAEISGGLILGAFQLLLGSWTLFTAPSDAHLPALLQRSRDYQASVSEILAEQVLHALYELLRGLEAADERAQGKLLRELAAKNPHEIYGGLVTVLLRLVFILFAEDRGLLPGSGLYVRHYSVRGLFERLRADAERYPDTMDHRFGAWAQLLALFRIIHGGCKHPDLKMPARAGHLFDPDRYPFLEGRGNDRGTLRPGDLATSHSPKVTESQSRIVSDSPRLPLVSDGTLHRILEKLCILEGERVSYRTLDVEEIGSVYQTIMGFGVETAVGTAIALKGKRKNGGVPASPVISLEQLLAVSAKDRAKWLKENADTELTGEADKRLKAAANVDDLLVALEKRIDRHATPAPVAKGGLVLQPGDERRRSGSHYTPRSFTEPIVRKTLEPILKRLTVGPGDSGALRPEAPVVPSQSLPVSKSQSPSTPLPPRPDAILSLKICDIAVGSAAFLVETCRQLADVLVKAWRVHGGRPTLPPDETEELLAMRTIAQRCLYGVDRNPMAVDLAKLSLWLATLAKDHPFTFVDHAIRCGDSLVGLTRRQIEDFTWRDTNTNFRHFFSEEVRKRTAAALRERQVLLGMGDDYGTPQLKRERLESADEKLELVRFIGDAAVAAFFAADKDKVREAKRVELADRVTDYLGKGDLNQRPTNEVKALRGGQFPVTPFHWEIEYPEVFDRENPGFDGIVGNPPFLSGRKISTVSGMIFFDYLSAAYSPAGNLCDLVAYFFRKAHALLRNGGCFGLLATSAIAHGDTREGGLRVLLKSSAQIYSATKQQKWPGVAAVVVSVIHVSKGFSVANVTLDGKKVDRISAYLFEGNVDESPVRLIATPYFSSGSKIYGQGFLFADDDPDSTPIEERSRILKEHPDWEARIPSYLVGDEINSDPLHRPGRYVIFLSDVATESELDAWPALKRIVEQKVKPERAELGSNPNNIPLKKRWWAYQAHRPELYSRLRRLRRTMCISCHTEFVSFVFFPSNMIFSHAAVVLADERDTLFSVVSSRAHEIWARFLGSRIGVGLRYTPSDCFETFPFPAGFETNAALDAAGREYYESRAALMQDLWLGLTEIYNLFHSPDDEALARLEALYQKRGTGGEWRVKEQVPGDRVPLTIYTTPSAALGGLHRLRTLHAAMDAAVLTAYGWTDLLPKCTCEFLLDYDDEGDSETVGQGDCGTSAGSQSLPVVKSQSRRKKPWRYRWPDEVRDEVLARLLKLNAERAEEERLAGVAVAASAPAKAKKPRGNKTNGMPAQKDLVPPPQTELFGSSYE